MLGVFDMTWLEGVWAFLSSASLSLNASIFVVIGVPRGSKFKGGSFNGCRPLRPSTVEVLVRDSGVFVTRPLVTSALSIAVTPRPPRVSESESRVILRRLMSTGKLDFLGAGNTGASSSFLGDSYALGIAGTGGTSSSVSFEDCSVRGLGVGRRDEEKF